MTYDVEMAVKPKLSIIKPQVNKLHNVQLNNSTLSSYIFCWEKYLSKFITDVKAAVLHTIHKKKYFHCQTNHM